MPTGQAKPIKQQVNRTKQAILELEGVLWYSWLAKAFPFTAECLHITTYYSVSSLGHNQPGVRPAKDGNGSS